MHDEAGDGGAFAGDAEPEVVFFRELEFGREEDGAVFGREQVGVDAGGVNAGEDAVAVGGDGEGAGGADRGGAVAIASPVEAAGRRWFNGPRSPMSLGTPQNQAPYAPGASPYVTGHGTRPKYFVPPTNPRTPTWKMYGTPPGVVPGDWPTYAPLGFGGYRFPAVGSQAYR